MNLSKSAVCTSVLALGGLLAAVTPALAVTVSYSTAGLFSTSGTNVLGGSGTSSLTFTGNSSLDCVLPLSAPNCTGTGGQTVTPTTTDILGTFTVNKGTGTITGSGTFTLTLTQTLPSSGTGQALGTSVVGTLSRDPAGSGAIDITFASPTSWQIGNVIYSLNNLQPGNVWVVGATTNQLEATMSLATPEPTFYALTGVGFAGLLGMAIRRKRQAA